TNAATHWPWIEVVLEPKNPMVGTLPACCARAASGHAAAPPRAASNSRRPMVTVIRPSRARCVKETIPRHDGAVFTFRGAGCWLLPPRQQIPVRPSKEPIQRSIVHLLGSAHI